MLVKDCVLSVSYLLDEKPRRYFVFCRHNRKDDFEMIGDFERKEDAEKLLSVMLSRGGNVCNYSEKDI